MENKQTTPMQQLIAELTLEVQSKLEKLKEILPERIEHSIHGEISALNEAIEKAKNHLPKEQEAIEDAYRSGQEDVTFDRDYENDNGDPNPYFDVTPKQYFTNKYKGNE